MDINKILFHFSKMQKKCLTIFGHNLEIATIVRESAAAVDFFPGNQRRQN